MLFTACGSVQSRWRPNCKSLVPVQGSSASASVSSETLSSKHIESDVR